MEIGAILLTLAVLVAAAIFVSKPFLFPEKKYDSNAENTVISGLLAEKDRFLGLIQELEQDHTLGKITDEDYPSMRADLMQKASRALRKIDELKAAAPVATHTATKNTKVDLDDLLAKRRAQKVGRTDGFCPHCGKAVTKADKFCPSCGKNIAK